MVHPCNLAVWCNPCSGGVHETQGAEEGRLLLPFLLCASCGRSPENVSSHKASLGLYRSRGAATGASPSGRAWEWADLWAQSGAAQGKLAREGHNGGVGLPPPCLGLPPAAAAAASATAPSSGRGCCINGLLPGCLGPSKAARCGDRLRFVLVSCSASG